MCHRRQLLSGQRGKSSVFTCSSSCSCNPANSAEWLGAYCQSPNTHGTLQGIRLPARLKVGYVGKGAQPTSKEHPFRREEGNGSLRVMWSSYQQNVKKYPWSMATSCHLKEAMPIPPHAPVPEVISWFIFILAAGFHRGSQANQSIGIISHALRSLPIEASSSGFQFC